MVAVGEFLCVFIFAVGNCLAVFSSTTAPLIPSDEVKTLQTISQRLNIRYWTVSQTSCSDGYQSFNRIFTPYILSNVTCDCSRDDTCHVTNIQLKGLNLSGVLPVEFANLKHLRELDLTWNYISGSIPTIFSRLRLTVFVLLGNRISGRIPDAIGHIPTLEELNLEDNQLGGSLPESLGNLNRLRRLMLSANNFSGTIPESFGRLKNLSDFRIDGNRMSGKIPEFIGNWARLSVLNMQGASLEGPIPKTISRLQQLNELRISDLSGRIMGFPNLRGMLHLQTLILRNCLINDQIPNYITELANLTTVDMSFNQLTGNIPDLSKLKNLTFLFLTNNSLTGAIPGWILRVGGKQHFDLSYNNFTDPTPTSCQQQSFNLNLVSSHSSMKGNSDNWCFVKDLPCSTDPQYYSLFINCGGRKIKYNRSWFEEDRNKYGFSNFIAFGDRWAYSSTGLYMYNDGANVTASDTFGLHVDGPEYFKTARLSPLSLKYYGLCLRQGSYRVQLHFAEIMYSNDTNFSSLGRRIFDVAIQRNIVLKDFNIAEEAGGVGKGITKDFKEVHVNGTTLEIHLYWAGQGTTAIPNRGVYGPLISGITVTPNFKIKTGLSTGVIVGIVLASFVLLVLGVVCLRMKGYLGGTDHDNADLRGLNTNFSLRQIKAATNDFSFANKIGKGGFGPVYKGVLQDGTEIAVKRLSNKSKQGIREFGNEMGTISALQHPNLVKLYGCCVDGKELLLIYEYLQNNSLHHALFGGEKYQLNLEWPTRQNICLGIAKGLAFLHEESTLKIVHRDIKATNVLLDKDLNAKISDFGLAKLDDEENTHITTRIAGTFGYMAPEYAMRGHLTDKADVYSFGLVVLEIVSGRRNTSNWPKREFTDLLDWANVLQKQGNLLQLVDPNLGSSYPKEEALMMLNLALLCTNQSPTLRPSMSQVVSIIEGKSRVQAQMIKPGRLKEEPRFEPLEIISQGSHGQTSTRSQSSQVHKSISVDGSWIELSSSGTKTEDDKCEHSSSRRLLLLE